LGWKTNKENKGHNNFGLETLCWKTKKKIEELEKFCVEKQRRKSKNLRILCWKTKNKSQGLLKSGFSISERDQKDKILVGLCRDSLTIIGVGLFSHALTEPHSHSWLHCVSYLMEEKQSDRV
jgi:hypothetical protein